MERCEMAERRDIAFHLDNEWQMLCTCLDANGNRITNFAQAEWRLASKTAGILKLTLGSGITATGGQLSIVVTSDLQSTIAPGTYDHEVWVLDGSTNIDSIQVVGRCLIADSLKHKYP